MNGSRKPIPLAVAGLALIAGGCASYVPPPSGNTVYHQTAWTTPASSIAPPPPVIPTTPPPAPVAQAAPPAESPAVRPEVLDVAPADPVHVTQTPTQSPAPSAYDASRTPAEHKVIAGETLFSIARDHLGDGNRWREIVDANPGLSAETLRAGQTLRLP